MGYEIAIMFMMTGISFILALLALFLEEEHKPIKIFFMIVSFFFLFLGMATASRIATGAGAPADVVSLLDSGYVIMGWILMVVIVYILIKFLYVIIMNTRAKKQKNKEGDWEKW